MIKRRMVLTGLGLFFVANFILAFLVDGMLGPREPSLSDRLTTGLNSFWSPISFVIDLFILLSSNPLVFFEITIFIVVGYLFYNDFLKKKKIKDGKKTSSDNQQSLSKTNSVPNALSSTAARKVILILSVLWFGFLFVYSVIPHEPGSDVGLGMILLLPLAASSVFYPIYFIVLIVKYLKEKSGMHILDKVMFYMLLVIGLVWVLSI